MTTNLVFKTTHIFNRTILKLRSLEWVSLGWRGQWGWLSSELSRGNLFSCLSQFLRLCASPGCQPCITPISVSVITSPLPLTLKPPSFTFKDLLWLHWVHSDNPRKCPHLKVLDLVTIGMSLLPYKVTFSLNPFQWKGVDIIWRQWHPTPVLLPGEPHGWRSLEGCSPWGH